MKRYAAITKVTRTCKLIHFIHSLHCITSTTTKKNYGSWYNICLPECFLWSWSRKSGHVLTQRFLIILFQCFSVALASIAALRPLASIFCKTIGKNGFLDHSSNRIPRDRLQTYRKLPKNPIKLNRQLFTPLNIITMMADDWRSTCT